ncbi:MAG: class I SAM-dependent methyltransferase [Cystobacter sp.]
MPRRLSRESAWNEHVPFAMLLMDLARPRTLVELGAHVGVSYSAFCQAVSELRLDTVCRAVDTWAGDPHSGFYGPEVLADLRAHHDPLYGGFSQLLQSTFEQARESFADGSIDVLHIDGHHSYESVSRDFEMWRPKLSASGLVLFHDIAVRENDFGVWRVWEELSARHPHFAFEHGFGLGVLAVGDQPPEGVRPLLEATDEEAAHLRTFFAELGSRLTLQLNERSLREAAERQLQASLAEAEKRVSELQSRLGQKEANLRNQYQTLERTEQEMRAAREELGRMGSILQSRSSQVAELETLAGNQRNELQSIHGSLGWKLVNRYWAARERVLPPGTRRGEMYVRGKRALFQLAKGQLKLPRLVRGSLINPATPNDPVITESPLAVSSPAPRPPWSHALTETSRTSFGRRVLIIAELSLPQCKRYRVDQKVEMLQRLGYEVTVLRWNDTADCRAALPFHGLVIFYRVPAFPSVVGLIEEVKRMRLPNFFDVDDLIFDVEEYRSNSNLKSLPKAEYDLLLDGAHLYRKALSLCDHAIASTPTIAERMREVNGGSIYIVENSLDRGILELADELERRPPPVDAGTLTIGYGSGTRTHDADFTRVSDALLRVLDRYPQVRLAIHGFLELPSGFERFSDRLFRIPFLAADDYLRALSSWQISIAPLEDTVFNDAKSNIKFIEASIFKVPTVASGSGPFREGIEHGRTGMIATTSEEWFTALSRLVEDAELRRGMGEAARRSVLERYHPEVMAHERLMPVLRHMPEPRSDGALKVMQVNLLFSPLSFGGATIVAEQLATRLHDSACDVTVFTGIWESPLPAYSVVRYESEGLPIIAVQVPHGSERALDHQNPRIRELFRQALQAVRPQVVHFHSIQKLSASLAQACIDEGIPYVITLHDAWWLCEKQFMVRDEGVYCDQKTVDLRMCSKCVSDPGFTYKRTFALRKVLDHAALLLAPSEFQRDLYLANGVAPERIRVNKNGIMLPQSARPPRTSRHIVRFAYLGGRAVHKGYFWLKDIFESLPESNYVLSMTDIQLRLGSSSIDASEWKVSGRVEVVPPYEQRGLDDFFEHIDVLLMPSKWKESFGMTVREALARNVWVITTEAGGVVEDIRDGVNGNILRIGDTAGFRAAIQRLLAQPERLSGYQNPNREDIRGFDAQAAELREFLAGAAAQA